MRDEFTLKTKDILAKRVSFNCSNPECKAQTIGPNSNPQKTVSIGVAAHITAASAGGPRFNSSLSSQDRSDISNGIWLCENCSTLIDKDPIKFSVNVLNTWKTKAEDDAFKLLQERHASTTNPHGMRPYAEAELKWGGCLKKTHGVSPKTKEKYGDTPIHMTEVIWHNYITWYYTLQVFNNSSSGLYNLKVFQHSSNKDFVIKNVIPSVNNLPPYIDLTLSAEVSEYFEGIGVDANTKMEPLYPQQIQGLKLLFEYQGENRVHYYTEMILNGRDLTIVHLDKKPRDY